GERRGPGEVRVPGCDRLELLDVEEVGGRARAVEIGNAPGRAEADLFVDHRAQRRHADAAANEHHLPLRRLDMEIAERPSRLNDVARPEREEIGRDDTRWDVALMSGRRHGEADVEDDA